jgi:hypothetical protein
MAARRPTAMIERLLEDDYLHEQIAMASARLRAAYQRARALRAQEAAQDKKLYDHVRGAAGSLTEAARRALGKPEPEPPKRWRRLPVLIVGICVLALVRSMHRAQQADSQSSSGEAEPPAPR